MATNSTNISFSVVGGSLALSWPQDHTGWRLQVQTNGLTGNWFDVPAATTSNAIALPVNGTANSVFYRLVYP